MRNMIMQILLLSFHFRYLERLLLNWSIRNLLFYEVIILRNLTSCWFVMCLCFGLNKYFFIIERNVSRANFLFQIFNGSVIIFRFVKKIWLILSIIMLVFRRPVIRRFCKQIIDLLLFFHEYIVEFLDLFVSHIKLHFGSILWEFILLVFVFFQENTVIIHFEFLKLILENLEFLP